MSETISELFEKYLGLPTLQELETSKAAFQRRSCEGSSMIKIKLSHTDYPDAVHEEITTVEAAAQRWPHLAHLLTAEFFRHLSLTMLCVKSEFIREGS